MGSFARVSTGFAAFDDSPRVLCGS